MFRPFSPKDHGWERGALGVESDAVCELCGFPVSQPSGLRQRRRVAGVCNTDHTGSR